MNLPGPGVGPAFPALQAADSLPLSHRGGPQRTDTTVHASIPFTLDTLCPDSVKEAPSLPAVVMEEPPFLGNVQQPTECFSSYDSMFHADGTKTENDLIQAVKGRVFSGISLRFLFTELLEGETLPCSQLDS